MVTNVINAYNSNKFINVTKRHKEQSLCRLFVNSLTKTRFDRYLVYKDQHQNHHFLEGNTDYHPQLAVYHRLIYYHIHFSSY